MERLEFPHESFAPVLAAGTLGFIFAVNHEVCDLPSAVPFCVESALVYLLNVPWCNCQMMNSYNSICCGSKNPDAEREGFQTSPGGQKHQRLRALTSLSWRTSCLPGVISLCLAQPAWNCAMTQDKSLSQFGLDCLQQQIADNNIIMSTWEGCCDTELILAK